MQHEEVTSTDRVYEGKILNLRVDSVDLPNGRKATREVVEHSHTVVVVPIDPDENVIFVRQYRRPVGAPLLEVPAGRMEPGESSDEAVQRELQEEAGFRSDDLHKLGGFWVSPGHCTEFTHIYVALDLVPSALEPDFDEDISTERVPLSKIPDMIRRGEIHDLSTVAGLMLVLGGYGG